MGVTWCRWSDKDSRGVCGARWQYERQQQWKERKKKQKKFTGSRFRCETPFFGVELRARCHPSVDESNDGVVFWMPFELFDAVPGVYLCVWCVWATRSRFHCHCYFDLNSPASARLTPHLGLSSPFGPHPLVLFRLPNLIPPHSKKIRRWWCGWGKGKVLISFHGPYCRFYIHTIFFCSCRIFVCEDIFARTLHRS